MEGSQTNTGAFTSTEASVKGSQTETGAFTFTEASAWRVLRLRLVPLPLLRYCRGWYPRPASMHGLKES